MECFGDDTCYSLAFGVPAALMGVATILLVLGKKLYVMKPPEGNIMTKVIGSIYVSVQLDQIDFINRHQSRQARIRIGHGSLIHA